MSDLEEHMVPLYHLELVRDKNIPYRSINSVEAAAEVFHEMLDSSPVEKIAVIYLNSSDKMVGAEIVAIGALESVSARMSEIFRGAIRMAVPQIVIAHNHVTGICQPSPQDYLFTASAIAAGRLLNIDLMDHMVISEGAHYSIKNHQLEMMMALKKNPHMPGLMADFKEATLTFK